MLGKSPQMAWQRVDGELVLLAVDGKELIGLNEVAARVWDLIDDVRDLRSIVEAIVTEFEVDAETARLDVHAFASELVGRGAALVRDSK